MLKPVAFYRAGWSGKVVVLTPGDIPTTDFYLTPRLKNLLPNSVFRFDSRRPNAGVEHLPVGSFVVIVRHASPNWLAFLEDNRHRWSGVAFLIDDDLPGAWRCGDVPLDYGLWTTGRYLLAKGGLARVCDRVWMSTKALQQRFSHVPSTLVEPLVFSRRLSGPASAGIRRWGYHGTRIHKREMHWLVPVVEKVQDAVPSAEFEVFGDQRVQAMFGHIPRVMVLPPCPWPEYVAHCHNSNLAVGVAPMLPGRFNAVRSHVKALDIARCGAVGLYSDRAPYAASLEGSGALLLPDDHGAWAAEVIQLLQDDALRLARYRQMVAWQDEIGDGGNIAELIGERKQ